VVLERDIHLQTTVVPVTCICIPSTFVCMDAAQVTRLIAPYVYGMPCPCPPEVTEVKASRVG
jgi:hypothetical protein